MLGIEPDPAPAHPANNNTDASGAADSATKRDFFQTNLSFQSSVKLARVRA
jgi:hypothetical protein